MTEFIQLAPQARDLSREKFGKLSPLGCVGKNPNGQPRWLCKCECGKECIVLAARLVGRVTRSCGCASKAFARASNEKRRLNLKFKTNTPTYRIWAGMKKRCLCTGCKDYHRYGGRGITIAPRWMKFENFLADMGPRRFGRTLERKENDGNYEPGNCVWATRKTQANNRHKPGELVLSIPNARRFYWAFWTNRGPRDPGGRTIDYQI